MQRFNSLINQRIQAALACFDPVEPMPSPPEAKPCTVLVPIYNGARQVRRCLASLLRYVDARHLIVLADDCSPDLQLAEELRQFAQLHPHFRYLRRLSNLGYLDNVNAALQDVQGDVLLLNSDTEVGPEWLDRLQRAAYCAPKVALACPVSDNATLLTLAPLTWLACFSTTQIQQACVRSARAHFPRLPTAVGFCMYMRRDALDALGSFDRFFAPGYGEEDDYAQRARCAGWQVVAAPDVFVRHAGGSSFGRDDKVLAAQASHAARLSWRWPEYESDVRTWWRDWPLREHAERVRRALSEPLERKPRMLHVLHRLTRIGGTESVARGLLDALQEQAEHTIVAVDPLENIWADALEGTLPSGARTLMFNRANVQANHKIAGLPADLSDPGMERSFARLLHGGQFDLVHVHHLAGWNSLLLPSIARALGVPVVLGLHCHYALCPDPEMVHMPNPQPCDKVQAVADRQCESCLSHRRQPRLGAAALSLSTYLAARSAFWQRLFADCAALIAPSEYLAQRIAASFPEARVRIQVIPHGLAEHELSAAGRAAKTFAPQAELQVGFLGGDGPHKGFGLLKQLVHSTQQLPIRYFAYGIGTPAARQPATFAPVVDAAVPLLHPVTLALPDTPEPFVAYQVAGTAEFAKGAIEVSVIVPVYNHFRYTDRCLRALSAAASSKLRVEVLVVDDASTDHTEQYLQKISGIRVLKTPQNLGFIGACNLGAAAAHGRYLVFLNNDTAVQTGWLEALIATFTTFPDAGLVGAKLVYPDGRLQESGGIIFRDGSGWNYGRFADPNDPQYGFVREVDYCSGAAIAIGRARFQQLGGFDTRYAPAYYEDTDLAFKVRQAGLKCYVQPASVVVHFEGISSGTDLNSGIKRYQVVNQAKFRERWAEVLKHHPYPPPSMAITRARQHRARKFVLVVDAVTPMPDQDSGSLRMVNLLKILRASGCAVSFFCEGAHYHAGYAEQLQQLGVEVLYHPYLRSESAWLAEHGARFDSVLLSRHYVAMPLLELVREHCPRAQVIFDSVDLHFLRELRQAELHGDGALAEAAQATKAQELAVIAACDLTLVVSPIEQSLLKALVPEARVEILSNIHAVPGSAAGYAAREGLLFVGGFQHPPNVDGVLWFVREVLPLVHAQLPELVVHLVGSNTPPEIKALATAQLHVHGFVPDITSLLAGTRLSIAPLRYGAGVKGKVNIAMAHGLPVIATSVAVEGMFCTEGEDVLIGDQPAAFAAAVLRAYQDPQLWQRLSDGGLNNVRTHFSFDAAKAVIDRIFLADKSPSLRLDPQAHEHLLIAASRSGPHLAKLIQHPAFPPSERAWRLAALDLILLPSLMAETYSLVLSEAHAQGIPVIAADRGAFIERIAHEVDSWRLDSTDLPAWQKLLTRLSQPEGRAQLAAMRSLLLARPARSLEAQAQAYWQVYQAIWQSTPGIPALTQAGDPASVRLLHRPPPPATAHPLEFVKPRAMRRAPQVVAIARDHWAQSQYRVHLPLAALAMSGRIEPPAIWCSRHQALPQASEILRLDPDVVLFLHGLDASSLSLLRALNSASPRPRLVFLLDDLITARAEVNPEVERDLAEAVQLCDRLICTTQALAEAIAGQLQLPTAHFTVVDNALPEQPWISLVSQDLRTPGPLRIVWAGAAQHQRDLELLLPVVQATKTTYRWVFFGLCPSGLAGDPLIEFHPPVEFAAYPAALAALRADIAVAPLEDTLFNRCKSPLKLLEYGALGLPVIATKLIPYADAPILHAESCEQWLAALRDLEDPLRRVELGQTLRRWVRERHSISSEALQTRWLCALFDAEDHLTASNLISNCSA